MSARLRADTRVPFKVRSCVYVRCLIVKGASREC